MNIIDLNYLAPASSSNLPMCSLIFGSLSRAWISLKSTPSLETFGDFAMSSFFIKKDSIKNVIFLGTCWAVSRFITEKGLVLILKSLFDDPRMERIITRGSIIYSNQLSGGISGVCFYLAQDSLGLVSQTIDLYTLSESTHQIGILLISGAFLSKLLLGHENRI